MRRRERKKREVQQCRTYESRTVVISVGLSVTVGLQQRVCLNNLVFQATLLFHILTLLRGVGGNKGKVRNDLLRVLRLTGTRFASVEERWQKEG